MEWSERLRLAVLNNRRPSGCNAAGFFWYMIVVHVVQRRWLPQLKRSAQFCVRTPSCGDSWWMDWLYIQLWNVPFSLLSCQRLPEQSKRVFWMKASSEGAACQKGCESSCARSHTSRRRYHFGSISARPGNLRIHDALGIRPGLSGKRKLPGLIHN